MYDCNQRLHALIITPLDERKSFIVDFDPAKEFQEAVEKRHGVSFSEYYENRARAELAVASRKADSYSGLGELPGTHN